MKVLLIGSGGREHALAWKLAQSPLCETLYIAPGNPGMAACGTCVAIPAEDHDAIAHFAIEKAIDLVVVGPEAPLVAGLADDLRGRGLKVFGPSRKAAQLEGSKGFMKDLCAKYDIPTAAYGRFTDIEKARAFIREHGAPIVVKTDGLAAGKGVIIAQSVAEAEQAAVEMISGASFGAAGREIVVEEFMEGEEISFFALADGKDVVPLATAQDHKRAYDGDSGPNTGGMGAYSPAHFSTPALERRIMDEIIVPTVAGMAAEGCSFTGVLYAGLMVKDGVPRLLEYNIRFGDPECQPLMMRLDGDLAAILDACAGGTLAGVADTIRWHDGTALCVVMAAKGYPGAYQKGSVIDLAEAAAAAAETVIFHAGTATDSNGRLVSAGGRVLGVTAQASTVREARDRAYAVVDAMNWPEGFCRRDIAWRALERGNP